MSASLFADLPAPPIPPVTPEIVLPPVTITADRIRTYQSVGGLAWDRVCKLTLTDEKAGDKTANVLDLSEFHITFDVQAWLNQSLKTLVARVYNVGQENMRTVIKQYTSVRLIAGYRGANEDDEVFKGTISYYESGKSSVTETVLVIHANDSDRPMNGTPINLTLEAGHTQSDVVKACTKAMGLQLGFITELDPSKSPRGRACVGMPKDVLRDIADHNGATFSVEDGKVNIIKHNETFAEHSLVLNSKTGMVGSPVLTMDGAIQVTSLLNSRLKPGAGIRLDEAGVYNKNLMTVTPAPRLGGNTQQDQVQPGFQLEAFIKNAVKADGFYKLASVHHTGDTRGNAWHSHLVTMPANVTAAPVAPGIK
jgi:hypothetical protein